jgi:signal transduction histidine kinase
MDDIINEIIFTVRKLSSSLRPGILDDLGLTAAIEWQTEEFRKRTGYACQVSCAEIGDLTEDKSVTLFRILQESLTNIIKHAEASSVAVSLARKTGHIEMIIRDNGKGLCSGDLRTKGSYGIIGMRERVKLFNGSLSIDGKEGAGTTITVVIPA